MTNQLQLYQCMIGAGQAVFSEEPAFLSSVCGRGVVVTIWDRVRRYGGMAHCIFAKRGFGQERSNCHIDTAIPLLLRQFEGPVSRKAILEAQILGAGSQEEETAKIAAQTVKAARKILRKFQIMIAAEDVGGVLGRKIIFNTASGDVLVLRTKKVRRQDWMVYEEGPCSYR